MGWIEALSGRIVAVDTSPFIFFIEQHPSYIGLLRPFFESVDRGEIQVVTSTVTLLEVLVQPIVHGDEALAQNYNDILLSSSNINTLSVSPMTAQLAAEYRANHQLKTPDAIQLATALVSGSHALLTNDRDFKNITDIEILTLSELVT